MSGHCEWPCVGGCCQRLRQLSARAALWRGLVKAGKKEEAQKELGAILQELGRSDGKPGAGAGSGRG